MFNFKYLELEIMAHNYINFQLFFIQRTDDPDDLS